VKNSANSNLMVAMISLISIIAVSALYFNNVADKRPTISVELISTTPQVYIEGHSAIMLPAESVLREAYQLKKNAKWRTAYKYAYVITKPNRLFSKEMYLEFHPEDGVDYKIIFSNKEPDPQLFVIR
jgi:hypothetical protein